MWQSLIVTLLVSFRVNSWLCGGDLASVPEPSADPLHFLLRSGSLSPVRILFVPISFELSSEESNSDFFDKVLPAVLDFFASTLQVYSVLENIKVPSQTCLSDILVPEDHKTLGVPNADIVVYLKTNAVQNTDVVGYAGACLLDSGKNNVIAGGIVLNKEQFSVLDLGAKYSVLMHELMHVLGFSTGLFKYWKNDQGISYTIDEVYKSRIIRGVEKNLIVTPNVLEKARINFACEEIEGIELEDFSSFGAPSSHWDKRVMINDFMTLFVPTDSVYSSISLALLKDTGWYSVNYELGQVNSMGRQLGCKLFSDLCIQNVISQDNELWCTNPDQTRCDSLRLNKGFCSIMPYEYAIPEAYIYFPDQILGGDALSDYCPLVSPYSNGSCRGNNLITLSVGMTDEVISDTSRCFESSLMSAPFTLNVEYAACYQVTGCSDQGAFVQVGFESILCPFTGGEFTVPGYTGSIKCPPSRILCEEVPCPKGCLGVGTCFRGKCECKEGRSGSDCSIKCPDKCSKCTESNCLHCFTGFILQNGVCERSICNFNCQTCLGSECEKCFDGFFLTQNTCETCPLGCSTCASNEICTSCSVKYNLQGTICSPICPFHCSSCTDPSTCTQCELGFSLKSKNCFSCSRGCKNCDELGCLECFNSYKKVGSVCILSCPDNCAFCNDESCEVCKVGFSLNYLVPSTCTQCPEGCKSCITGFICTHCFGGFRLTSEFDQVGNPFQICRKRVCSDFCMFCVEGFCQACIGDYWLVDGECFGCVNNCGICGPDLICSECLIGFVLIGSTCEPCPQGCLICDSSFYCVSCAEGYGVSNGVCNSLCTDHCVSCDLNSQCSTCEDKYYLNSLNVCEPCCSNCKTCQSSFECQECVSKYSLVDGCCVLVCPDGCSTCTTEACTSCLSGFYAQNQICMPCGLACRHCENDFFCIDCLQSYFISGPFCEPCEIGCSTCTDKQICTECYQGYWNNQGICIKNCAEGCLNCLNFACIECQKGYGLVDKHCIRCNIHCSTCDEGSNCLTCDLGYELQNSQCLFVCTIGCELCGSDQCLECKPKYYLIDGDCIKCIKNCDNCVNGVACVKCIDGYYLANDLTCSSCPTTCLTCLSSTTCNSCQAGYTLTNGDCIIVCPSNCLSCTSSSCCSSCKSGFFISNSLCQPCSANCLTCSSLSQCQVCNQNYILSGQDCVLCPDICQTCNFFGCSSCKAGYYLNNRSCFQCSTGCKNCDEWVCSVCLSGFFISGTGCAVCPGGCSLCDSLSWCSACKDNYFLVSGKCLLYFSNCQQYSTAGKCLNCKLGFFLTASGSCDYCPLNCLKCPSSIWCTSCASGFSLVNGQCVYICQTSCSQCTLTCCLACKAGYYINNGYCYPCTTGCNSCSDLSLCFSCKNGYYIRGTGCQPCPNGCSKCDSLTWCSECSFNYKFTQGKCIT